MINSYLVPIVGLSNYVIGFPNAQPIAREIMRSFLIFPLRTNSNRIQIMSTDARAVALNVRLMADRIAIYLNTLSFLNT